MRILSAGAAQAVVERIAESFQRDTGHRVSAEFSAVGAMKARVVGGEPVDVVVLTGALIDELMASGHVKAGSRSDLGKVGTGVAVRAGEPAPEIAGAAALRAAMLAADRIVCPDPATATAGKVVLQVAETLRISEQVKPKMQFFPNGYAAMRWLAESRGGPHLGITQITEIRANQGVAFAGPLPPGLQAKAVYSVGLGAQAPSTEAAQEFIARLTAPSARAILAEAGHEFDD